MKIFPSALIACLVLNSLIPFAAFAEEDTSKICETSFFTPDVKKEDIAKKCGRGPFATMCVDTRKAQADWAEAYKKKAEESCKNQMEYVGKINELNQNAAFAEVKAQADQGISDINTLLSMNKSIREGLPKQSAQNVGALKTLSSNNPNAMQFVSRVNKISSSFTRAVEKPEIFETRGEGVQIAADKTTASNISGAVAQLETLDQSQSFILALLMDKKKNEEAIQKLTKARSDAEKNQKNTNTVDGPEEKKGGFDAMSLLPLAAPLAGMLMQQQAKDSSLSSNPNAGASPALPAPIAGTSLEPKARSQTPPSTPIGNGKGPDTQMHMPETLASSPALEPFVGDISQGSGDRAPSSSGGAGSFSAGSSGGSDSSGSSTPPPKGAKAADPVAKANEDGAIAYGGGSGGGYGGNSSTDSSVEGDSMKDMLHDMEATIEDNPTGLFAEGDPLSLVDGVASENSESLFPRVRACYVRNLKKGSVLNGLGEKLPD